MKSKEIKLHRFLLAEDPTEDLNRFTYIYSPPFLSLILIIPEDDVTVLLNKDNQKRPRKTFNYGIETFELVVLQNNVHVSEENISAEEFLNQAWQWYENYLRWEDKNIDEDQSAKFN